MFLHIPELQRVKSHSSSQILLPHSISRTCCSLPAAQGPAPDTQGRSASTWCDQRLPDPAKHHITDARFPLKQAEANTLKTKPGSPGFAPEKAPLEDARRLTIGAVHRTEMSPSGLFWAQTLRLLMSDTFNAKSSSSLGLVFDKAAPLL